MEKWVLRPGRLGDVEAVLALERATVEAPHWSEAAYMAIASPDKAVEAQRRCLFVIKAEGGLLGFAVGSAVAGAGQGEIESVAVETSARRRGVGRALCAAVMKWCGEQGARQIELEVRAGSLGAIALYEQLGFVVSGQRPEYYAGPTEDAVLMRFLAPSLTMR